MSIEAQIAELKEFAKRENLNVTEFITEAKTAKMPGREQFAEVLKKIEKGMANAILSWHPDRLARNSIDGGKIIYLLDTGKLLDLKFPSFWFEKHAPRKIYAFNRLLANPSIMSITYLKMLNEVIAKNSVTGVWPSKAPYGYLNNPKTRGIDIDDENQNSQKSISAFC